MGRSTEDTEDTEGSDSRGTPEKRRAALAWQMELEDLLIRSGGVTGGR